MPAVVADDSRRCLPPGMDPSGQDFVRGAIRVLESSGRRPADYTAELHSHDPWRVWEPNGEGPEVPSAVFFPRQAGLLYPVRVTIEAPCVVSWLWQPDAFTSWQREVIERAQREYARRGYVAAVTAIEVRESAQALAVEIWTDERGPDQLRQTRTIQLRKQDLAIVGDSEEVDH